MMKKMEHGVKSVVLDRHRISAVDPETYYKRFIQFMKDNILQDKMADYANKELPVIPNNYFITEVDDSIRIDPKE